MNRHFPTAMLALFSLVVVAGFPAVQAAQGQQSNTIYFETFDGLTAFDNFDGPLSQHWTVYRGSPQVIAGGGRSSVLQMAHPLPGVCGFFKDVDSTSLYLSNMATTIQQQCGGTITAVTATAMTSFADGMIEFDIYFVTGAESGASAILAFRMQSDDTYYALRLTNTRDWKCYFAKYTGCTWRIIGTQSACGIFQTGVWAHVVVTIGGPWFQCYKDGALICEAVDETWQRGIWGATGIGLQNNYYGGAFYIDNFRIPNGFEWTTYRGSPAQDPSAGRSAASMVFDHPGEYGDGAPFGDLNSYSAYISRPDTRCLTNAIIEFDILFDNPGGQKAFLTFRMQSDSQYYALRLTSTNDWECYFLRQNGWGSWDIIGTASAKGMIPLGIWTHIRVVMNGQNLECYMEWGGPCGTVSSHLLCSAFVTEFDPCPTNAPCGPCGPTYLVGTWGGVGFYSGYNRGRFHIDNLKIHVLK